MAEQDEILKPRVTGRTFLNWTDQEAEDFGNAFSLGDFELIGPQKEGEEGWVRVRVPASAETILVESIADSQRTSQAFESPLAERSPERIKDFLGETVNAAKMPESQEADLIQTFGKYIEVSDLMRDRPDDAALQDLKGNIRMLTHRVITGYLRGVLSLAATFSWENYMDGIRAKYGHPENVPKDVENEIMGTYKKYEGVKELIDRDVLTGKVPRFLVVNSAGEEVFRSNPALNLPQSE